MPFTGRTVGRYSYEHGPTDDRRPRRAGGRRARPDPYPHGGRQEPGEGGQGLVGRLGFRQAVDLQWPAIPLIPGDRAGPGSGSRAPVHL